MTGIVPRTDPLPGPFWSGELLGRLRADHRFRSLLEGVETWSPVPITDEAILSPTHAVTSSSAGGLGYLSSGSTGEPKAVHFSARDWEDSVAHRAACLSALGVGERDRALVLLSFGPWFSGDHITDALLTLGAKVLPAGIYGPHLAAIGHLLERLQASVLITTPSAAMALAATGTACPINRLILVGEALPSRLRDLLEQAFACKAYGIFAASEGILAHEDLQRRGLFRWDPELIHLEVLGQDGRVRDRGVGEVLYSRRYGHMSPMLRYRLHDILELEPDDPGGPVFRFLGRSGHGFGLATGVMVTRAQLDHYLDNLGAAIHRAEFRVTHGLQGTDQLRIHLLGSGQMPDPGRACRQFRQLTPEIEDLVACGYLSFQIECQTRAGLPAKRRISVHESPWAL